MTGIAAAASLVWAALLSGAIMTAVGATRLSEVGDRAAIECGDKIGSEYLCRIVRAEFDPPAIDFLGDP